MQALIYDTTAGDEVEDLLMLLAYAQQQMPQIQAVSCGAIASDYQRLRVEQVRTNMQPQPHCTALHCAYDGFHTILISLIIVAQRHLRAKICANALENPGICPTDA